MFEFILGGSGTPLVRVTIVENGVGSFTFTLAQIGSGTDGAWQTGDLKGEIRGLFFDVDGNVSSLGLAGITLDEGRTYSTLTGAVTAGGTGQNNVTGFTKPYSDVNMNGAGLPADGGYDVGVALGTSGIGAKGDDIQGVTFTLNGLTGITLEDFANQDFGLRMMSIGTVNANEAFISGRDGSAKIVGDSGDIATNEAPEATAVSTSGDEDAASIPVTLTGIDSDGTVARVRLTSLPSDGLLYTDAGLTTLAATGVDYAGSSVTFYFVPDANFNGEVSFDFTVTDNDGASDATAATATITVDAVNDAPEGADNTVAADEDTAYVFTAADFGFSDPVEGDSLLAVKISTLPVNGTLLLNGLAVSAGDFIAVADINGGNLTFEPDANANGAPYASFTFQVQDDGGTANGGVDLDQSANTITVNVDAVNDAPEGTDKTVTTDEDTAYVFAVADFGFSDPVEGDSLLAVKISTLPTNGTLKLDGNAVSAGDFISEADISAGKLTFEPDANANGAPYSDFTFQVQDDGGTANGGVDLDQSANTVTVNVNAVNDAPAGADNTVATDEDTAYVFTAADFGFSDPVESDNLQAVKISTLPINGTLLLSGSPVSAGDFISAADITAGNLTFAPAANGNGDDYASFTFQVQDDGGTANGGVDLDQSANTITVNVEAVNDAPAGADNTVATDEDTAYVFTAADFGFSDPVEGDALQAVKISTLPTNGTLLLNGLAVSTGDFISEADISAGNLTFAPDANANGAPYSNFTFQVQDDGGTANGGVDLDQTPNTITVNVKAVNDAPEGADNTVATNEDTAYVFTMVDFGFSDPVEGDNLLAVKIASLPINGALLLNGSPVAAGDFIAVADITAGNLTFAPAANANGTGYASFDFQVQDDGGTANGGVDLDQSANTITVDVNAVNDAPEGANNTVTTNEDMPYVFTVADFGFSDPVEGDNLLAVKISTLPINGTLLLSGSPVAAGDFIAVADITAGNLTFASAANGNGDDYASFTFQVQDDGGTTNGGVDLDQSANTITVDVNAVNDAPAGADSTVATDEDTAYVFTVADFGFSDPVESDNLQAVKISTLPINGTLLLSGSPVSAGDFIAVADITAGNLTFAPAANANGTGYASFDFQVQDDGGTANGGIDLDQSANTITVNVDAVNDAPQGTDNAVTTNEDTAYVFTVADFGFSDPVESDNLQAVKISTLPINGALLLNGLAVSAGDFIAVADIIAGNLTFAPAANANGDDYASFTFQVQDDGGTTNGGVDLDQSANTITIDVTPVNDAPVAVDDRWFISEKTNAQFGLAALLGNDTDVENDAKTVLALCTDGVNWVTDGSDGFADGIITSGGVVVNLNAGTVSYLTAGVTADSDSSFLYRVADTGNPLLFDEGKVTVTTINIETGNADQTINLDISPYNADSSSYAFIDADSGNDTVSGTQATVRFFGGQGNDTLSVGTFGANDTVNGGSNTASLAGTNKGDVMIFDGSLDLTAAGVSERILEIETLRMADGVGNDSLTLNAQDVIDLGSGDFNPFGKDLVNEDAIRVDGDAGDALNLTGGGWSLGAPAVSGNGDAVPTGYVLYVHDGGVAAGIQADAYALVQTGVNVSMS